MSSEACSEPLQTAKMEHLAKTVAVNYFHKTLCLRAYAKAGPRTLGLLVGT